MVLILAKSGGGGNLVVSLAVAVGILFTYTMVAKVRRARNPSAGRGRKRLFDSDDWIDLGTSQVIARWSGRPGGAKWGLLKVGYSLLRTEQGHLVINTPGRAFRIPYYMSMPLNRDYVPVTPQEAVNWMAATGGGRKARRLFPDLEPQATISGVGRQV